LRLAGILSNDPVMRKAFIEEGGDLHSRTAYEVILNKRFKNKEITFNEFLVLKEEGNKKIKVFRQKAKSFNFGLLFGAGSYTIRSNNIEPEWTLDECNSFIGENGLQLIKNDPQLTVADYARRKFFETYHELEKYNERTKRNAEIFGYVRSVYGAVRRLPGLSYVGGQSDNKLISNLHSISLNSPIQNMEAVNITRWIVEMDRFIEEKELKSYFFITIHDAVELFIHRGEVSIVCKKLKELAEKPYEELNGIPLEVEGNVSDYWGTYKKDNWELWDIGHNWDKYLEGENV
jgi:DNA polymerase I-like protein with 3'-5' exonuclease and polymerase domains